MKKILVVLAAAVIAAFGLTVAASLWSTIFVWNSGGINYGDCVQWDWNNIDFESYAEKGRKVSLEAKSNGVTIRVNRVYYNGSTTILDMEIETPDRGVTIPAWNVEDDRKYFYAFSKQRSLHDYNVFDTDLSTLSDIVTNEDDDPNDNILSVWFLYITDEYNILTKPFSLQGGFIFSDLNYLDSKGEKVCIEGEWKLEWTLDNDVSENSVIMNWNEPITVDSTQKIRKIKVTECCLGLEILVGENNERVVPAYSPVIRSRDGSVISTEFPLAQSATEVDYEGRIAHFILIFPHPIDVSQIESIQYGPVKIPVNP